MNTCTPDASCLCTACNKSNARLCSGCKSARYCSTVCQRADWPTHKLLCATFSSFNASSRPTNLHFRAILFPFDEDKPKIIWLHRNWKFQNPGNASSLGLDTLDKVTPIQYNVVLKRYLSDIIFISYRDAFLIDGSKPNKSVAAITATRPGQCHDWGGPIMAFGAQGDNVSQNGYRDLDMNDFRHLTDHFFSYFYTPSPTSQLFVGEKVKGVRINCNGDVKMFNRPHFEAVEILSTHPIFSRHDTSDIAEHIGLPIFTGCCIPNPKWADERRSEIECPFVNLDATFLHLCCDPKAEFDPSKGTLGWGFPTWQWDDGVGSVLVVRQDKKPLFPLHVEALCKYCRYEVPPLLEHISGEASMTEPMGKDQILSMFSRHTFLLYWYKLLAEKHKEGVVTTVPHPYDT